MSEADVVPLAILACILACSAVSDLRRLRIPNTHVLAALVVFMLAAPFTLTLPDFAERLIVAGVTFGIGFCLFSFRLFGGGDVKMMSAVMLYVPATSMAQFLWLFSASLIASSLAIILLQRMEFAGLRGWESCNARGHVPVAVSIFLSVLGLAVWGSM